MEKVIYEHSNKNGWIQVIRRYNPQTFKRWEGVLLIDEEPTDARVAEIVAREYIQIEDYFPLHNGVAFIVKVEKKRPIQVHVLGSGPLKVNCKEIGVTVGFTPVSKTTHH